MHPHLRHVEQLAGCPLVVYRALRAEHIRRAARLDQLQLLAVEKAVLEGEHGGSVRIALDRHTDDLVLADILAVTVVLAVFRIAEVEARVILAVADLIHLVAAELWQNEALRVGLVGVDRSAVRARDAGGVVRGLVAALDLERVHARAHQLRDVLDHAHILAVIKVSAARVLLDRKVFAGAFFLHQRVVPAARLRARAVVGVAPGHVLRDQAAAGVRNAHRAVHERLDLQLLRRFRADLRDLVDGQLAREHDALRALLRPEIRGLVV